MSRAWIGRRVIGKTGAVDLPPFALDFFWPMQGRSSFAEELKPGARLSMSSRILPGIWSQAAPHLASGAYVLNVAVSDQAEPVRVNFTVSEGATTRVEVDPSLRPR